MALKHGAVAAVVLCFLWRFASAQEAYGGGKETRAEMIASQAISNGIDPVLIMRIPTMVSGICVFFVVIMQVHWYSNMHRREIFMSIIGASLIIINMVLIFFASIHCPKVMWMEGKLVENDCVEWWKPPPQQT